MKRRTALRHSLAAGALLASPALWAASPAPTLHGWEQQQYDKTWEDIKLTACMSPGGANLPARLLTPKQILERSPNKLSYVNQLGNTVTFLRDGKQTRTTFH